MGCRCRERTDELRRAAASMVRGDVRTAGANLAHAGRTLIEDARTGALRQAASARLSQLRGRVGRGR